MMLAMHLDHQLWSFQSQPASALYRAERRAQCSQPGGKPIRYMGIHESFWP